MRPLREWIHRLWSTLRPGNRPDRELQEELRLHEQLAMDEARRRGLDPQDAVRAARIRIGGTSQAMEALRDQRGLPWLDDLGRDVRSGLRTLRRSKGFTATALLSLALGIGANAGIFSLLDQVLLRPLPVREPDRLVQLEWSGNAVGANYGAGSLISYPLCRELHGQGQIFEGVACRHPTGVNLSTGREHEPVSAEIVSGSYFSVLGIRPELGRLIDPSDDRRPGMHPVVVLSHDYWVNRLGGARDVVGRRVLVNSHPMTVIGIAPASFRGVDLDTVPAVWIPAMMKREATPEWYGLESRRTFWIHAIGRLQPGVTAEQARTRLQPWFEAMLAADLRGEDFPPVNPEQRRSFLASTIGVLPAARGVSTLRGGLERPLRVLMGGALLLLTLAALNVAGLLLARGAVRTREVATRMTLGASRGRVARQFLVESLLLAAGGSVIGVAAAPLIARVLRSFVAEGANLTASVDRRVLMFAIAASAMTGMLCGVAPVFQLRRLRLSASMTERSGLTTAGAIRVRKVLVGGQLAFALVLLVVAGLFIQTLARLHAKGPGFATANLLMFSLDPSGIGYTYERAEQVMREVLRRVEELPEVERAAVANSQLLTGGTSSGMLTVDAGERRVTDRVVHRMRVAPGFFATMGMPVIAGRDFDQRDLRAPGTPPGPYRSVVVNETFARRYFGDRSPIGARIGAGNRSDTPTDIEIIGVVREVNRRNLRDQDLEQVFLNFWDNQSENGAFYVRVRGNPESAAGAIRAAVAAVDPAVPVRSLTTVDDQIARALSNERALATLSSGFGGMALVISIVGLYGVMAFVATARQKEIGLRIALGASRSEAVWLIVRDALVMLAAGIGAALPAVWALRRVLESQLFGVGVLDAPTIAAAVVGLALVGLAAATMPAWRASGRNPNALLRAE